MTTKTGRSLLVMRTTMSTKLPALTIVIHANRNKQCIYQQPSLLLTELLLAEFEIF